MSQAPKKFVLTRDDVPNAPEWFGKFLEAFDSFSLLTTQCLQSGITFADNVAAELKTVSFTAPYPVWTPVVFSGTWANWGTPNPTCALQIEASGRVTSKGVANTGAANATIYTAPVGYRPAERVPLLTSANGAAVVCVLETNGTFATTGAGAGAVQLDGLSWFATTPVPPPAPTTEGWPLSVATKLSTVSLVVAGRTVCEDGTTAQLAGVPQFDWQPGGDGTVSLRNVTGLVAGRRYKCTLLLLAG